MIDIAVVFNVIKIFITDEIPSTFNLEDKVTFVAVTLYSTASSTVQSLTINFFVAPSSIIVYLGESVISCPFLNDF